MSFAKIAADTIRVRRAASAVYTPAGIDAWLNAPNPALDHNTPNRLIAAGDVDPVLAVLDQLASGAYA